MTLYTTQRKQYECWSGQSNHRVCSQQELGSEMRNLALSRSLVSLDISWLQTVETIRILKNNLGGKIAVGNLLVWKFSFAPIAAKIRLFKSYCYPIYGCALWRHSFQNFIRKLTVSYSDTFKRLINVPRYTSSSLAFTMNATDHAYQCGVPQICLQLDEQSNSFPNSIVAAIANSDAYHQSVKPLMDKWESMFYYTSDHR